MRIAFFGGSFDPPHSGHLRIAQAAAERLHLERILLAPVARQPLKREGPPPASYSDRLAMLRLLLASRVPASDGSSQGCAMQVSELDAPRLGNQPNYTYDTLQALRAQLAPADQLFVLLGADSFLSIRHWHRAAELLLLASWIVAARPGSSLHQLDQALPPSIRPSPSAEQYDGCITQQLSGPDGRSSALHLLPDLHEDVSATQIRAVLAQPPDVAPDPAAQQLIAPQVVAYIRAHNLYR